ncbi:MAG: hypothetical protein CMQ40_05300 [Gammaproteobacteria bacterium]|nr:hypothetical protein [Gammaproteobacteria bacterium]
MLTRGFRLLLFLGLALGAGCVQNYAPTIPDGFAQPIYGVGYAVIEVQNGSSIEEKRLMAVKASKLEAYKSLVEQLYGQYVEVTGQMTNSRIGEEIFRSRVEGIIYGAELVEIKPVGEHSYETTLRLGGSEIDDMIEMTKSTASASTD